MELGRLFAAAGAPAELVARPARPRLARRGCELHLRDAAVRKHAAAVRRSRLHGDLGQTRGASRTLFERRDEAVHKCAQLGDGAVLRPDLANLAAERERHALRLDLPPVPRPCCLRLEVSLLLGV